VFVRLLSICFGVRLISGTRCFCGGACCLLCGVFVGLCVFGGGVWENVLFAVTRGYVHVFEVECVGYAFWVFFVCALGSWMMLCLFVFGVC